MAFLGTLEPHMLPKSIFFFNMHLLMSPKCVSDVKPTIYRVFHIDGLKVFAYYS